MPRWLRWGWLLLLAGCSGPSADEYLAAVREQQTAPDDAADILARGEGEKSLAAARAELNARRGKIAASAEKIRALPKPSPAVVERLEMEKPSIEASVQRLQSQVARIRNLKLPGADDFFRQLGGGSSGLLG